MPILVKFRRLFPILLLVDLTHAIKELLLRRLLPHLVLLFEFGSFQQTAMVIL